MFIILIILIIHIIFIILRAIIVIVFNAILINIILFCLNMIMISPTVIIFYLCQYTIPFHKYKGSRETVQRILQECGGYVRKVRCGFI